MLNTLSDSLYIPIIIRNPNRRRREKPSTEHSSVRIKAL
jgi:hypothetical protein